MVMLSRPARKFNSLTYIHVSFNMVFEPVSVLGIVGTALGVLSFLSSTVENITVRLDLYAECQQKIKDYEDERILIMATLDLWSRQWSQGLDFTPYTDTDYELLWGTKPFDGIKNRVHRIHNDIEILSGLIKRPKLSDQRYSWRRGKSPQDVVQSLRNCSEDVGLWEDMVLAVSKRILRPSKKDHGSFKLCLQYLNQRKPLATEGDQETWIYKFLFAIYKNTEIANRVARIRKQVSDLHEYSKISYDLRAQGRSWKPESDRPKELAKQDQEYRNSLLPRLKFLYDDYSNTKNSWSIVFGNPSVENTLDWLDDTRVNLTFTFQVPLHDQTTKYVACPYQKINRDRDNLNSSVPEIIVGIPRPLRTLESINQTDFLDSSCEMLAHVWAAREAAQTAIVLQGSPWVRALCFCSITIHEGLLPNRAIAFCARRDCSHMKWKGENTYFHLAVLLAELALGAPINVYGAASSPDLSFGVPKEVCDPSTPDTLKTWEEVLDLVENIRLGGEGHIDSGHIRAMKYAYTMSQITSDGDYLVDYLEICSKGILNP
jgi:hypothetical protein